MSGGHFLTEIDPLLRQFLRKPLIYKQKRRKRFLLLSFPLNICPTLSANVMYNSQ
jgi:hypothetical protein